SLLGVMTIDFELTALSDFVRKLRLLDRGYLFIIESPPGEQPRILAHPNPSAIPETYPGAGAVPVVAGDNNSDGGASETPYYKRYLDAFLAARESSTEDMFAGWVPFDFEIDGQH